MTTTTTAITAGQEVEITIRAGLVTHPEASKFSDTAEPGTLGTYLGPHPSMSEDDWHLVAVGDLLAPLHLSQFVATPR